MNSGAPYAAVVGAPFMGTTHGGHVHRNATTGLQELKKSNLVAATDPTVGDDVDDGYAVGSQWVNASSGSVFTCTNASAGAANWTLLGGGSGVGIPAGTGTEVQYRVNATTFGAVTGSSWDATTLTLPKTTFSGVVGLAAGTAAAPSLCFSADTDTGIYSAGSNRLDFTCGGTKQAEFYGEALFVKRISFEDAGYNVTVFNMSSGGSQYGAIMVDPGGVASGAWSLGYTASLTNTYGTPVITWTGVGNVGILTRTPAALLQVGPTGAYRSFLAYGHAAPYGTALRSDGGGWAQGYYFENNAGTSLGGFGANGAGTDLNLYYIGTYVSQLVTVLANGNVGIGKTAPGAKLDVMSSAQISVPGLAYNETSLLTFQATQTAYAGALNAGKIQGKYFGTTYDTSALVFLVHNAAGSTVDAMCITNGGNVGIGTVAPAYRLVVNAPASTSVPAFAVQRQSDSSYRFAVNTYGNAAISPDAITDLTNLNCTLSVKSGSTDKTVLRILPASPAHTGNLLAIDEAASATTKIVVTPACYVGIGTATPGAKLHVSGVIATDSGYVVSAYSPLGLPGATNTESIFMYHDSALGYLGVTKTGSGTYRGLSIYTSGLARMTISAAGYVGIGATPSYKFHVQDSDPLVVLFNGNTGNFEPASAVLVYLRGNISTRGRGVKYTTGDSSAEWFSGISYGGFGFTIGYDATTGQSEYAASSKVMVLSSGNVGIGTTAPASLLDIQSSSTSAYPLTIRGDIDNDGGYTGISFGYNNGSNTYLKARIHVEGTSGEILPDMHFLLDTAAGAGNADLSDAKLSILNNGNVGIGTTTPATAVHILRPTTATTLTLEQQGSGEETTIRLLGDSGRKNWEIGKQMVGNALSFASSTAVNGTTFTDYRLVLLDTGYVGVGQATPTSLLHVTGTDPSTSYNGLLRLDGTARCTIAMNSGAGGFGGITFFPTGTQDFYISSTDGPIILRPSSAEALRMAIGGNVGIGTGATVSAKLHVIAATEQLRLGYDAAKYTALTTNVDGELTVTPSGGFMVLNGKLVVTATGTNVAYISYQQPVDGQGGYMLFRGGTAGTTVRGYVGFTHNGVGAATLFTGETADYVALRGENGVHLGVSTNLYATLASLAITVAEGINLAAGTTTGTKIGTATNQKLGFWNATPVIQQTTGSAAATFVQNSGNAINDASTFDGYTIAQMAKIIRTLGLAA